MNFHVFIGHQYYPVGGLGDYKQSFSTYDEAKAYVDEQEPGRFDWWDIVESTDYGLAAVDSGYWGSQWD